MAKIIVDRKKVINLIEVLRATFKPNEAETAPYSRFIGNLFKINNALGCTKKDLLTLAYATSLLKWDLIDDSNISENREGNEWCGLCYFYKGKNSPCGSCPLSTEKQGGYCAREIMDYMDHDVGEAHDVYKRIHKEFKKNSK